MLPTPTRPRGQGGRGEADAAGTAFADDDLHALDDDPVETVVPAANSMEGADAEFGLDAELAEERLDESAPVAGDNAEEVDASAVYGSGRDSEALEDDDEAHDDAVHAQDHADAMADEDMGTDGGGQDE